MARRATSVAALDAAGFTDVDERAPWADVPAGRVRRPRRGARGVAAPATTRGRRPRIVGAHTDSPGLRLKPHPDASAPAGASSASRSTAARCSTAGSTAIWGSPAGWSPPTARDGSSTSPSPSPGCPSWPSTSTATSTSAASCSTARPTSRRCGRRRTRHRSTSGSPSGPGPTPAGVVGAVPVRRAARGGARRRPLAAGQRAARQPGVVLGGDHGARRRRAGRPPGGDRPVRPRGGRLGQHHRRLRAVARPPSSSACTTPRAADATSCTARSPASSCVSADNAHAMHPNYPERHDPTSARSSTTARRSRSTPTSATPRRPTRRALFAAGLREPACRSRRSCRATTCRAARRSARSRRPASGSPPSTWVSRSCRCTRPASCAASPTRRGWRLRSRGLPRPGDCYPTRHDPPTRGCGRDDRLIDGLQPASPSTSTPSLDGASMPTRPDDGVGPPARQAPCDGGSSGSLHAACRTHHVGRAASTRSRSGRRNQFAPRFGLTADRPDRHSGYRPTPPHGRRCWCDPTVRTSLVEYYDAVRGLAASRPIDLERVTADDLDRVVDERCGSRRSPARGYRHRQRSPTTTSTHAGPGRPPEALAGRCQLTACVAALTQSAAALARSNSGCSVGVELAGHLLHDSPRHAGRGRVAERDRRADDRRAPCAGG